MSGGGEFPFAELVRGRMKERGMGLRELCRAVGVDASYFSKVLSSRRSPPAEEDVLRLIARTLELDPTRLVVSAGRIPREWRRLWTDDGLFSAVHGLAGSEAPHMRSKALPDGAHYGAASAPPAPAFKPAVRALRGSTSNWDAAKPAPPVRRDFGEELL